MDKLAKSTQASDFLGEAADKEKGARVLPIDEALSMAIHHNRTYLTQKEMIYLQALNLTLIRH